MALADITMYGADWCGDCRRSKRLLEELDVQVTHIDVEVDESAERQDGSFFRDSTVRERLKQKGFENVEITVTLPNLAKNP